MKRSLPKRVALVAAAACGAAPLAFGLFRFWITGSDRRVLWMATTATLFMVGVLATAIGRRRARSAVTTQSTAILVVATLLAVGTGYLQGPTSGPGVWMIAVVFGLFLASSSVLVAVSRPDTP
jgi:peptidoglycan/LPS O-acetylase OafA/YrhL